jgi:hypothetical protein
MPRCVDQYVFAISKPKEDPRRIDRDTLCLLVLERINEERILERFCIPLAVRLNLCELSIRQRAAVGKKSADDGAFAVVDVAGEYDVQAFARGWFIHE